MIIPQNRCSESYHKTPLFLTPFYVDNVDNLVYKSLFPLKPFFLMWITFFDLICIFSAIYSCILRSLCKLSIAIFCRIFRSSQLWFMDCLYSCSKKQCILPRRCIALSRPDYFPFHNPHPYVLSPIILTAPHILCILT